MEKINIAELLKDCPQGMELDCTMYDNVVLEFVANVKEDTYPIKLKTKHGTLISTTEYGCYDMCSDAKCVIFPKGKTSWEGFHRPFKDGDILSYQFAGFKNRSIYIYRNHPAMNTSYYVALSGDLNFMISPREGCALNGNNSTARLATEEEKTKLFQAIKENGYKWNPDIKTLEKLVEPKFKVGDRIRHKCPEFRGERIVNICCDTGYFTTINDWIDIAHQDDWELVSEKLVGPKFNVGDIIQDMDAYKVKITEINIDDECYGYESIIAKGIGSIPFNEQDNWKLVSDKFDITSLKTFDQVLVRDFDNTPWEIEFFSRLLDGKHFKCSGLSYVQCIPYKGNEHLNGKKDDCDKYFKTWE